MISESAENKFFCRRMQPEDVPACAAIEAGVLDGWSESSLSCELSQECARLFVAEKDGCIAALAVFQLICDEANLYAVSTAPQMRRCGAANALLSFAFSALAAEGAANVFLEVRCENLPARRLYQKLGFEENGLRRNFYRNPPDHAVLMSKTL